LEERVAAVAPQQSRPAGLPTTPDILARASGENFRVASRLLPRRSRQDLLAIYGFARLTDQLGDEYQGDRLAALDWLEAELDRALAGQPADPLVAAAARTVKDRRMDDKPLRHLIQANREDQVVRRYDSFSDLLAYCELSANPVGRLVLSVLGVDTPERQHWSDLVCTGLQLAEHWQDVAEDAAAGRTYLPAEDLARFGVEPAELTEPTSSPALRGLMAFEVARARTFLDAGSSLIASLGGRPRWAVAGFVAGGQAALDAIAAADFDVLSATRRPTPLGLTRRLAGSLVRTGAHR
jgi:squalene synthase HpnC